MSHHGAGVFGVLDRCRLDVGVQLEHEAAVRVPGGGVRDAAERAEPGSCTQPPAHRARAERCPQVSLFDRIIESKEDAHFALPFVRNKYKLLDQARGRQRRRWLRVADARRRGGTCGT